MMEMAQRAMTTMAMTMVGRVTKLTMMSTEQQAKMTMATALSRQC